VAVLNAWRRLASSQPALDGLSVRRIADPDLPFLQALYAATRADEVASTGWAPAECARFLAQQFGCQHRYYQDHYADAEFLLIVRGDQPVGRLYWRSEGEGATLIDVSLVPEERGRGLGSALMQLLAGLADRDGLAITLHVEPANPALHLYRRFGFEPIGDNSIYTKMRRPVRGTVAAREEEAVS
jgi:ribosomal protein S18 acetylase RimI-like enzyme